MQRLHTSLVVLLALTLVACGASRAFTRGERAQRAGDLDTAVEYYRQAVQGQPDRAEYKIALERATFAAAIEHGDRGRKAEDEGRLEEALREYRRASELDPSNRQAAAKAADLERIIRERIEAARPKPEIDKLKEAARRLSPQPELNPAQPLGPVRFNNAGVRDILTFMGEQTGINVTFDRDFQDRQISVNLEGVTLEEALQQIMMSNQLFYKVLNQRTIIVAQDVAAKRTQYEEQVVRTFFLSHTDSTEMAQILNVMRVAGMAIQPTVVPNKTTNTIVVRATAPVIQIMERLIEANDKPRAEVIIDVQILEVVRDRAKKYGLELSNYSISTIFSPEAAPGAGTGGTGAPAGPPTFNLNTISQGISTADFYLSVPSATLNFLESDSNTKVLAKPQLRGTEGQKVSLNLGEEVPVVSTAFTPLATGGAAANPLTSYSYRTIGVIVDMTPRVTYNGEIILDLALENSARSGDVAVAGVTVPAFASRKVNTRLRLRDGESNLLAGLLREDERRSLRGFPGILRMPILSQLFAANDNQIRQTDIVMLLTPHIVRTHELTARDLGNIYIGTQGNMALGGPPPLIQGPAAIEPPPEGVVPAPAPAAPAAPGPPQLQLPPGTSPTPGFTTVPPAAPAPPATPPAPAAPPTIPPAAPPPVATPQTSPVVPPPLQPSPPATPPAEPTPQPPAPATTPPPQPARVLLSPPAEMRVGAGPYTVPVSIAGATRLTTLTLSISYNPAVLRVRTVQEGSFMRQSGINASFSQQVDPVGGRIDIAITRPGDLVGAGGTGLLAAILFETVAPGTATLNVSGVGTTVVTGAQAPLVFQPAVVTVK